MNKKLLSVFLIINCVVASDDWPTEALEGEREASFSSANLFDDLTDSQMQQLDHDEEGLKAASLGEILKKQKDILSCMHKLELTDAARKLKKDTGNIWDNLAELHSLHAKCRTEMQVRERVLPLQEEIKKLTANNERLSIEIFSLREKLFALKSSERQEEFVKKSSYAAAAKKTT